MEGKDIWADDLSTIPPMFDLAGVETRPVEIGLTEALKSGETVNQATIQAALRHWKTGATVTEIWGGAITYNADTKTASVMVNAPVLKHRHGYGLIVSFEPTGKPGERRAVYVVLRIVI